MKSGIIVLLVLTVLYAGCDDKLTDPEDDTPGDTGNRPLQVETLVSGLETPWDLAWGPDDMLWVTERRGVISRVHPTTGELTRVGQINDVIEVSESGLMGMAFHPDFDAQPYVYAVYSFRANDGGIRNRLVRLR
jgi:glucose/arabinose dehydrogenase